MTDRRRGLEVGLAGDGWVRLEAALAAVHAAEAKLVAHPPVAEMRAYARAGDTTGPLRQLAIHLSSPQQEAGAVARRWADDTGCPHGQATGTGQPVSTGGEAQAGKRRRGADGSPDIHGTIGGTVTLSGSQQGRRIVCTRRGRRPVSRPAGAAAP